MFIKVLTEDQIAMVAALAREIWTEHYVPIIGNEQVEYMLAKFQSQAAITEQIRNGADYFLIRERDEFIGYIGVETKGVELFLSKIYVKSPKRGKGFGRKTVEFAKKLAQERRLTRIVLTVNRNNLGAIRAYEKLGFLKIGPVIQDIGNGFVMDDYRMELVV